jgi:hypothetical protein
VLTLYVAIFVAKLPFTDKGAPGITATRDATTRCA